MRAGILLSAAILSVVPSMRCAIAATKNATGTELSDGGSWEGGAPGPDVVATFDASANTTPDTLSANVEWKGILFLTTAPSVSVTNTSLLKLGSSGIDLSDSGKSLTLTGGGVSLVAPEIWTTGTAVSALLGITSTISLAANLLTIDGAGNSSFSGIIGGDGGLTKNGSGSLTLAAQNTYGGGTTINAGVTTAGTATTHTTALGSGLVTLNGGTLRLGIGGLNLQIEGLSGSNSSAIVQGVNLANNRGTLTIDRAPGLASSFGGAIKNGGQGTLTLVLTGGGTQTLYGNNTYTGNTIVRNGVLKISGGSITSSNSASTATQFGNIVVGDTAGQKAVLLIDGGVVNAARNAPHTVGAVVIGDNNSAGAIYLNSGTITVAGSEFWTGSTGWGYLRQQDGLISTIGYFPIGRPADITKPAGCGIVEMTGGTLTHTSGNPDPRDFEVGAYDPNKIADPTLIHGVLNVSGGSIIMTVGLFQVSNFLSGTATVWNNGHVSVTAPAGVDIQTFNGSTPKGSLTGTGYLGVVNLGAVNGGGLGAVGGGTITTSRVQHSGTMTGIFNFHGGFLKASNIGASSFMTGLTHCYVYPEGGTIDSNNLTITIDQVLEGPSGVGLKAIPLASGGTGYIGPPVISILGGAGATLGGTSVGVTASAIFDVDTGSLSGIAITNPGSGLQLGDSLTVTLTGGGATVPAALAQGTITLTADNTISNSAGNLAFTGGGTVCLTAANSFQGTITVMPATTVQFGSTLTGGGVSGTFTGTRIVNDGVLVINRSNAVTLAPLITGTGTLTQNGNGTTTLTNANYSGKTIAHAGTLTFGGGTTQIVGPVTENASATVTVDAATMLTAGPVTVSNLVVGGTLILSDTSVHASRIAKAVTLGTAGRIDLRANSLIVQAAPDGSAAKSALLATMAAQIITGRAGGNWDGPGITSGLAAANPAFTIALIDNADGLWPTAAIDQSVNINSVIAVPALIGDFNGDSLVNGADFARWAAHANTADYSYTHGDATHDGLVNNDDFWLWYGRDSSPLADMALSGWALQDGLPVPVPEPGALILLVVGGLALLGTKRVGGLR